MIPPPTSVEWVAAAVAGTLVVLVGGLLVVRRATQAGTRVPAARLASWLLACVAVALLLVEAVLLGTGIRASMISAEDLQNGTNLPRGPFVVHLFDANLDTTERVAGYGAALLVPLAATFWVLALAVADRVRSLGLRAVAALACGLVVGASGWVAIGDSGPVAGRAALGIGAVAAAALSLALEQFSGDGRGGPLSPPG